MCVIAILGAGIAGIGAGNALKNKKHIIYEKKDYYGGLCNSFNINGFTFDTAIHLSFTNNKEVRKCFEEIEYLKHLPNPYNFYSGKWIKHPVQSNLYKFSPEFKVKAIKSYLETKGEDISLNYKKWLYSQYGEFISDKFFIPYTWKYWTTDAEKMSTSWIGNRLKRTDFEEILFGSYTGNTENGYYASEMRYPEKGGYKSFLEPIVKECNIEYEKEVIEIDTTNKIIKFENSEYAKYSHLISSLPLPEIIKMIKDIPEELINISNELDYTSIILVSIGFDCKDIYKYLWYYIYDEDIWASRIYCPSIKSPDNVPERCSSIQMELHYNKKHPCFKLDKKSILTNVKYSLKKLSYPLSKIKFIDIRNVEYGNVIYKIGMEKKRDIIQDYLMSEGIISIGRFGKWKYFWSDQSLLSGINVLSELDNL